MNLGDSEFWVEVYMSLQEYKFTLSLPESA